MGRKGHARVFKQSKTLVHCVSKSGCIATVIFHVSKATVSIVGIDEISDIEVTLGWRGGNVSDTIYQDFSFKTEH